jgi:hypothetical protein
MRSFNDAVNDGTNVRSVEKRTAQLNSKRGNAFYGDSGTQIPETTRDEIEKNAGAGHKGNDVDFSQRYAQSEADEHTEQAERITRSLEKSNEFKYSGQFADPDKRAQFVEELAERLRGKPAHPVKPQEPEEKPFSNEEFFSNPEELKKAGRQVRPQKL